MVSPILTYNGVSRSLRYPILLISLQTSSFLPLTCTSRPRRYFEIVPSVTAKRVHLHMAPSTPAYKVSFSWKIGLRNDRSNRSYFLQQYNSSYHSTTASSISHIRFRSQNIFIDGGCLKLNKLIIPCYLATSLLQLATESPGVSLYCGLSHLISLVNPCRDIIFTVNSITSPFCTSYIGWVQVSRLTESLCSHVTFGRLSIRSILNSHLY